MNEKIKISACIIVYNEEGLIDRCLKSIKDIADEIIIVHDGECSDKTLEIARKYTNKIFTKPHVGIAEPLRSFSYEKAQGEWILQVDADEYFDLEDVDKVKGLIQDNQTDAYNFKWELWNGREPIQLKGLQKMGLFRRGKIEYQGLPQTNVKVLGKVKLADIFLRHRPLYDNVSWKTAGRKRRYWMEVNARYFFPELVKYECFNTTADSWIEYTKKVRKYPLFYLFFYPLKNFLGQLKNGLGLSWIGMNALFQQYVYYFSLYWTIWKMEKKSK